MCEWRDNTHRVHKMTCNIDKTLAKQTMQNLVQKEHKIEAQKCTKLDAQIQQNKA